MLQLSRKWRNANFSARWRHKLNIMAYSERYLPTSYLRIMLTFAVLRTVSKLYTIFANFLINRKWRNADFSARWRHKSN